MLPSWNHPDTALAGGQDGGRRVHRAALEIPESGGVFGQNLHPPVASRSLVTCEPAGEAGRSPERP